MKNSALIPVFNGSIQNQNLQLANARNLHSFLEVQSDFNNWIKNRITDYGFIQDEDYIIVTERTNGRPRKEYHITLDMGKELGMVERNEKGRQIRRYFIEMEKRAKQEPKQLALPEPEKKFILELKKHEVEALEFVLTKFIPEVQSFGKDVETQQRATFKAMGLDPHHGNRLAARGYDIAHEFRYWTDTAAKLVKRIQSQQALTNDF